MTDTSEMDRDNPGARGQSMTSRKLDLHAWFVREVLPLEASLTTYLQHNWRGQTAVADMVQDVYVKVFQAAQSALPESTAAFVFATARNLLIDRVRHEKVVPLEAVEDLGALEVAADIPGPDEQVIARDELRQIQKMVELMQPRWREVFLLHHVEGLSRREIGIRMGISEITVTRHLNSGLRFLANKLYQKKREPRQ